MWQTWKTQFLTNLLLIAAIEYIDLPKAGCDLVGAASGLLSHGKHGLSKLLEKKLSTSFQRFDPDGDGVLSREDFVGVAERYADKEKFDPVEKEAVRKAFSDLFTLNTAAAGTNGSDRMTVDLLIASRKMQRDNPQYKKVIGDIVLSLINPMKVEQRGYLNYGEYRKIFENFGFDDVVFTKAGFGLIDANHDGKVSVAECDDALFRYMSSDDVLSTGLLGLLP